MYVITDENSLCFYRQLKLLKKYNIQEAYENNLLNGPNNYLVIQKIMEVQNQLNELKLSVLLPCMLVF
jgi:hypothetical protein